MPTNKKPFFTRFARRTALLSGRPLTFVIATGLIVVWAITGPIFQYSDTWQLVINTSTTIITFLMVFLIQNTQNRDTEALQIKIDELIWAIKESDNALLDIEELEEEELDLIRSRYLDAAKAARNELRDDDNR